MVDVMIFGWLKKRTGEDAVQELYARVAEASRAPQLYLACAVPDTVEGRLESLTLHAMLVLRRMQSLPEPGPAAAQDFVDTLFRHIDAGLRELGVGDAVVPKRMKSIAENFYGRVKAYTPAFDARDATGLAEALARNIPGVDAARLAEVMLGAEGLIASLDLDALFQTVDLFGYDGA
jgi:cytochrome b pre-mRNA-processing protein 3